jgi:hypothetical protein
MRFGHNALDFLVNFITYLEPPYSLDFNYIVVPLLTGFLWVHILMVEVCKKSSQCLLSLAWNKPCNVPMHHNFKLIGNMRSLFTNETLYKRKVRKLIYLTHIRPDISAVVSIISRFLSPPQEAHNMALTDQILRYVKRIINYGLCLQKVGDCTLKNYM